MNEMELLQRINDIYQRILAHKLVGIYVHGSLAFGCFNWWQSDIDFLAVVRTTLCQSEKEAIISALLDLEQDCPPKGLEMSVVLADVCCPFIYPTPYELHYSNAHTARFRADLSGYCRTMCGTDRDLAAHITITNQVGFALCGPTVEEVFAPIPRQYYVDSILSDIAHADEEIDAAPVYCILNLCRVAAYLEGGLILSKQQGGEWGLIHLPDMYGALIQDALAAYSGGKIFAKNALSHHFAAYMLWRIHHSGACVACREESVVQP